MRAVRVATAFLLAVALPGLIFGWVARIEPLGLLCAPAHSQIEPAYPTTGQACRSIDLSVLYWLAPAAVLMTIVVGVAAAGATRCRGARRVADA